VYPGERVAVAERQALRSILRSLQAALDEVAARADR
jgi:hypothetical protein